MASYESGGVSVSDAYPRHVTALLKNDHVVIKDRPCKIVELSNDGDGKVHIEALDILTGEKYEDVFLGTQYVSVPNVTHQDYQLMDMNDGFLEVIDDGGEFKEDLKLPEGSDLSKEIEEKFANGESFMVTVMTAMGEEKVVGTKTLNK